MAGVRTEKEDCHDNRAGSKNCPPIHRACDRAWTDARQSGGGNLRVRHTGQRVQIETAGLDAIVQALTSPAGRPHGECWQRCIEQRGFIEAKLKMCKLSKVRRLLQRQGIEIPYATLHRFAVSVLEYGRGRRTIPVSDPRASRRTRRASSERCRRCVMTALPANS